MAKEIWKPVKGFEGLYEVSNQGRVRSLDRTSKFKNGHRNIKGKFLRPSTNRGYETVVLYKNREKNFFKVHRLVGIAFIPNPDNLPQINHMNGIKNDNRLANLEWICASGNALHAFRMGLVPRPIGEKNPAAKLTESQVIEIKQLVAEKEHSYSTIAGMFGISKSTIAHIAQKRKWAHL